MPIPREQLRLTDEELDELLTSAWEVHVATASPEGEPHVVPLWFAWHAGAIWLNSLVKSRRTRDIRAGSPAAVCADTGVYYGELRGAVLRGRFAEATSDPALGAARRTFAEKYWGGNEVPDIKSHVWLKMIPDRIDSWDFRKIPAGRDKRLEDAKQAGKS